jgi:hypothetical protein
MPISCLLPKCYTAAIVGMHYFLVFGNAFLILPIYEQIIEQAEISFLSRVERVYQLCLKPNATKKAMSFHGFLPGT